MLAEYFTLAGNKYTFMSSLAQPEGHYDQHDTTFKYREGRCWVNCATLETFVTTNTAVNISYYLKITHWWIHLSLKVTKHSSSVQDLLLWVVQQQLWAVHLSTSHTAPANQNKTNYDWWLRALGKPSRLWHSDPTTCNYVLYTTTTTKQHRTLLPTSPSPPHTEVQEGTDKQDTMKRLFCCSVNILYWTKFKCIKLKY